jgi:endoglucanase
MISMQDETNSGETGFNPFATAETVRDWDALNATFGADRGVLYELYNEPRPAKSAANWALWANGGTNAAGASDPVAVGMQPLLDHLRAAGGQNVMVLDGLGIARPDMPVFEPLAIGTSGYERIPATLQMPLADITGVVAGIAEHAAE